jgi:hypothetical protein
MKLGVLSVMLDILITIVALVSPFDIISTTMYGEATRAMVAYDIAASFRSMIIFSIPGLIGVIGSIILDFFCLLKVK